NLLLQIAPRHELEVVKDLMVDDDVEVNLKAISFEYGGGLLEWKNGDEKVNEDEKDDDVEKDGGEKAKSIEEERPQTIVVREVAKTDIAFFNQEEFVGEAYQVTYNLFAG
ncbi:hypothetical protein GIB67_014917, partial [Kingdonia uniflora]